MMQMKDTEVEKRRVRRREEEEERELVAFFFCVYSKDKICRKDGDLILAFSWIH